MENGISSINRQIPGPPILVCKNDLVVVDVINKMGGSAAAIHWHGIHQRETPYMDGVPYVTQCPIPFATTFRYMFWASDPGTHFYHSHAGNFKINGQYGALIIRQPRGEDPNYQYYDYDLPEHTIIASDWMNIHPDMVNPGLTTRFILGPTSLLINGRGRTFDKEKGKYTNTPLAQFLVRAHHRYRFRLICSISHACAMKFQIENHRLIVIASDSFNVRPMAIDTLYINAGERYDFVLHTNNVPGDYWIRIKGVGSCQRNGIEQFAILRYLPGDPRSHALRPTPSYYEDFPTVSQLNYPNSSTCTGVIEDHPITQLQSHDIDSALRNAVPNYKFYIGFHNIEVSNNILFDPNGDFLHFMSVGGDKTLVGTVNMLSLELPSFPPLTQPEQINENEFCNENQRPASCNGKEICPCVHIIKVALNSIVELIIVDESPTIGGFNHPFHLHGYKFLVTDIGQHPDRIPMTVRMAQQMDTQHTLRVLPQMKCFNQNPPFKDTVSIPSKGFAIVRFRADNPGFWIMHCHYDWHLDVGMGVIFQVGEVQQMQKAPSDFPRCGNFMPAIEPYMLNRKFN